LYKGRAKQLANVILLMTMLGAVSTHYALHDKLDRMAPGIVFSLLLLTRLILYQMGKYTSSYEKPIEVKTKDENEEEEEEDVTQESNNEESEDEIDDKQKTSNEKKKE
jgi:Na+-transporting methylmalonyl-CoA/oxaloacetate decarboxylase gamma subunit